MKEPNSIDPALLKEGDLFRGANWKKGKNHIYKETITLHNGDKLVESLCYYWFRPYSIREPSGDKDNLCSKCKRKKVKL